jgi:hypothetical protein
MHGGITLVLGAGISISRGIPSWAQLVRWACKEVELSANGVDWLVDETVWPDALALQIALEEVEHKLRSKGKQDQARAVDARKAFADLLSKGIYGSLKTGSLDSLATLVETLREDQARSRRRIVRVITFNADDLLEIEANAGHDADKAPVLWPVSRAHHHPRRHGGAHGLPPISVYHVHGYLPRDDRRGAEDSLVFTDAQYWASMANPLSIANRVFTHALHDSHCIFIGMSMRDMNVNRWLGAHAHDVESARMSQFAWRGDGARGSHRSILKSLRRHYWFELPQAGKGSWTATFFGGALSESALTIGKPASANLCTRHSDELRQEGLFCRAQDRAFDVVPRTVPRLPPKGRSPFTASEDTRSVVFVEKQRHDRSPFRWPSQQTPGQLPRESTPRSSLSRMVWGAIPARRSGRSRLAVNHRGAAAFPRRALVA